MNEYEITSVINDLSLDLRVEIVISDILNSGYDATDLFIHPVGLFQRKFSKDILHAEVLELKNRSVVLAKTPRESLYDMLPQVLFHPVINSKSLKSVEQMIGEYKRRVMEEQEARKFFMLYEFEFYKQRVANVMHERNLVDAISYSMDDNEIISYWRLPQIFNSRQKGILFYLFPVFHKIRGHLNYMQEVYRLILDDHISIERHDKIRELNYDDSDFTVGNIVLSANSIIGNHYNYYYPFITIKAGPLTKEMIYDYLPGGKNIRILEKLNEYFIPVFCEREIMIETEKNLWFLKSEEKVESRLGYSMCL